MLISLTRKLCPLMSMAIATIGCGKKISDPKSQPANNTENSEVLSAYTLKLDGAQGYRKQYQVHRNAHMILPMNLKVRAGSTTGKAVEITYDVNEYDSDDYDFKCIYLPSANPDEMSLQKCHDYYGEDEDYGDVSEREFPIAKNQIIQLKFTGVPANGLVVEAIYKVKWI